MKKGPYLAALALALLPIFGSAASATHTVRVAYAASLVATMEGPLKSALRTQAGVHFSGEAKGSRALAHLISAGLRQPDDFISAEPRLLRDLYRQHLVRGYVTFGSARMVIAYSSRSPHRALFAAAARGKIGLLQLLNSPGVNVGRTDPQLDPKGARTIEVLQLLGKHFHDPGAARAIQAKAQTFPEEDLAARVESGELDAGFFYSTELPRPGLRVIELPNDANLSHRIAYALAVMRDAPDARTAHRFAAFVLYGPGKAILEKAGVRYFAHPRITGQL